MIVAIIAILALGFLILVHEFGHFAAAKLSGIKVEEFAFGFGPRILSKRRGETIYAIRVLPFGGFVKMTGMGYGEEVSLDDLPRSYENQSVVKRIFTVAAGPFMNILLAMVIFWVVFLIIGNPQFPNVVHGVLPKTPAAAIGLQKGDRIIEIDHVKVGSAEEIKALTKKKAGQKTDIAIIRSSKRVDLKPVLSANKNGIYLGVEFAVIYKKGQPLVAASNSAKITWDVISNIFKTLKEFPKLMSLLFSGKQSGLSGPVGIYKATSKVAYEGLAAMLGFIAVLSISLGVFNILPFPPLDGGHVFFAAYEVVFRRPINRDVIAALQMIGFSLLFLLFIFVTYSDIVHPIPGL